MASTLVGRSILGAREEGWKFKVKNARAGGELWGRAPFRKARELKTGRAVEGQTGKKMQLLGGQKTTGFLVLQGLPVSSLPATATMGGRGSRGSWGSLSCVSGSRLR